MVASTDSGATWIDLPNAPAAVSIASSADGNRVVVGAGPSGLGSFSAGYEISIDSGATWMATSVPSSFGWNVVASSANGSKLIAANPDGSGLVYTSDDFGGTWTTNSAPLGQWISIASSADGTKLSAAQGGCCNPGGPTSGDPVYTSSDSGATWSSHNVPDAFAVASSADGNKLVAVVSGGGIWISQSLPTPTLNITRSESNLLLAWLVPSMDFVLQENSDLSRANWTNAPVTPALNFTNLQNEVTVSLAHDSHFYRLKH